MQSLLGERPVLLTHKERMDVHEEIRPKASQTGEELKERYRSVTLWGEGNRQDVHRGTAPGFPQRPVSSMSTETNLGPAPSGCSVTMCQMTKQRPSGLHPQRYRQHHQRAYWVLATLHISPG